MMEAGVHMNIEEVKKKLEEAEFRMETKLCQGLMWDHGDKTIKVQEEMSKIQEQMGEICGKSAEVSEVQRNSEKLKSSLVGKGAILGKITCENETVGRKNVEILEGVNTELVWSDDDLISRDKDEAAIGHFLATGNKHHEADKKADISYLCCKDEVLSRLEADFRNVEDKLNRKNEQFNHLEEAYEKLRSEFQSSKQEWEKERLIVCGKISSLRSSLDSQMRISDSLQTKLKMYNHALAHEESRRKLVEVQLSESQALFENIYAKCIEEQAKIDQSTAQKEGEIASLRYLLATNDILLKEMECKNLALERQKEDMCGSLKEFQEAEIKHAASFKILTKLQKKFESLEQVHGSCSTNLERKEIKWTSQLERLKAEAKGYLSDLYNKEMEVCDLRKELEMCRFSLLSLNEEMNTVVMLLKSEYSEAYAKLFSEHENNLNKIFVLAKDLEDSKNMIAESHRQQRQLEELVQEVESVNKAEMAKITLEQNFIKADYQKSRSDAENLKSTLEEAQKILKHTEAHLQLQLDNEPAFKQEIESLKNSVREHERNNEVLQEQVTSLESAIVVKDETLRVLELENKSYIGIIEDLESKNICLDEKISALAFEWKNILGEMEGASNQLREICCQDESLRAAFRNTEYASVEKEQILCEEISSQDENNQTHFFPPNSTKASMSTNERLPFLGN